jgi:hypothetical protein
MRYVSSPKRFLYALQLLGSRKLIKKVFIVKRYDSRYKIFLSVFSGVTKLDSLVCFIHGVGFVPITQTPHYSYARSLALNSNSDENYYSEYLKKYYPIENLENSLGNFRRTFLYVKEHPTQISILVSKMKFLGADVMVVDGVHRAAILAALDYTDVKCDICI